MLIVAVDTSQTNGSVTLADGRADVLDILETVTVEGGTFSAQLIPRTARLLQTHGKRSESVDGFCAAIGPGSFTGLRIGLAAVKGLAEVLRKPIAAVSMLEALARGANVEGRLLAVMDARRSEFYVGDYERFDQGLRCISERLCSVPELMVLAKATEAPLVSCEEKIVQMAAKMGIPAYRVTAPGSVDVARIGWEKLLRNETTSVAELDANYLRQDDALFLNKK